MKKSKLLLPALVITTAGLVTFGVVTAHARWFDSDPTSLAQSLAQKLGIGEDKVTTALDSIDSDRQAQWQTQWEQELSQLVSDGKITEAQKQAIIQKKKELLDAQLKARTELAAWARENGIDLRYLMGGPFGHHPGRGMMMGW